ncbi:hypothetical protein C7441_12176 [Pseudaminobacter salicylatoxidans]|uniref:Uncharacterized protein n=1 Tax=Pseudaminobacter salicylatoxidans TaxID=93369 RepID=A0A316CAS4_PSESE|nr:hypothetical protein [Pseudaminobacter salicylatoxidans]PWJ75293.1 hypothetical protein C7441_12176 [Pseudaminobacter salicylatoxidans]
MTISYPFDLLAGFPGWSTEFDLLWRQEQSRQANGVTRVKDFGSPLWRGTFQSRSMRPNELDEWRARLDAMENGLQQFRARSLSRCYPMAYPNGTGMGTVSAAAINTINANRKSITVKGLPAGFQWRVGDMLQIGTRNLHRIQEAAAAGGTGVTGAFEIRPPLWPETAVNDPVTVVRPSCLMTVVPGSVSSTADLQTGRGSISFQALESR